MDASTSTHLSSLAFAPHTIRRTVLGESVELLIADATAARWYSQLYREPELAFIRDRLVRPGDVIVDCGAHQGLTGILFSRWVGRSGIVLGFEANPRNVELARRNAIANGASNFIVRAQAVGSGPGIERFIADSNSSVYHGDEEDDAPVFHAPIARLDDLLEGRRVNLLKIDVEGWEFEVLDGAEETIATHRPNLVIEVHNYRFEEPDIAIAELLRRLKRARYGFHVQATRDGAITPYNPVSHTPASLAQSPVIHVYAKARF
jgi:FkbM family methyltransferase